MTEPVQADMLDAVLAWDPRAIAGGRPWLDAGFGRQKYPSAADVDMEPWRPSETPHFSPSEMACRCGCGAVRMLHATMELLEYLRDVVAAPLVITSGYRCVAHNARIGGAKSSPHVLGAAADIRIAGGPAWTLIECAIGDAGARGIGIMQHGPIGGRYVHVDVVPGGAGATHVRPRIWTYP